MISSGSAALTTLVPAASGGELLALLDAEGSALIHEHRGHLTQPIGGTGGRIGYGIIER